MAKTKDIELKDLGTQCGLTKTFVAVMERQAIRTVYQLLNMHPEYLPEVQRKATEFSGRVSYDKFYEVVNALREGFPEQVEGYKPEAELRDCETALADIAEEFDLPENLLEALEKKGTTRVFGFMNIRTESFAAWGFSMGEIEGIKDKFRENFKSQSPSRPDAEIGERATAPI